MVPEWTSSMRRVWFELFENNQSWKNIRTMKYLKRGTDVKQIHLKHVYIIWFDSPGLSPRQLIADYTTGTPLLCSPYVYYTLFLSECFETKRVFRLNLETTLVAFSFGSFTLKSTRTRSYIQATDIPGYNRQRVWQFKGNTKMYYTNLIFRSCVYHLVQRPTNIRWFRLRVQY